MSHMTTIELAFRDLPALLRAADRCGLDKIDEQTFKWYGRFVGDAPVAAGLTVEEYGRCDFALRVRPDAGGTSRTYEIGVRRSADGRSYTLHYDTWAGGYGLERVAGVGLATLKSMYAREVARSHAQRAGLRYQEQANPDGSVRVTLGG